MFQKANHIPDELIMFQKATYVPDELSNRVAGKRIMFQVSTVIILKVS